MCEETLLGIQEKPALSGTLGAPSLQERTEEGPCSEDSVFPPPAATVKTLRGPKGLSKSLRCSPTMLGPTFCFFMSFYTAAGPILALNILPSHYAVMF